MLSGVLVHPQKKAVIPFAPEPILKQDGRTKNDCERNAAERFLEDLRREHPHLKLIVTEDGLGSNAPPIDTLKRHNMNFILGCKPGDHTALFAFLEGSEKIGAVSHIGIQDGELIHRFRWMHSVPLNDSRSDCVVNFIEYWEIKDGKEVRHFSWVTDLTVDASTLIPIMRAARARWEIENATFNTLKNGGYAFEHNFGHGYENLSVNFALLMMLAFFIDQVLELACLFFQKARQRLKRKMYLWQEMQGYITLLKFKDWEEFMNALAYGVATEYKILLNPL